MPGYPGGVDRDAFRSGHVRPLRGKTLRAVGHNRGIFPLFRNGQTSLALQIDEAIFL
jgi:hypothetical protein